MKVVTDVETQSETDHLYVMSASGGMLPGLVKVRRSKNPLQRALDLQDAQPYHILIHTLSWDPGIVKKMSTGRLLTSRSPTRPAQNGLNFQ